ncbi:hypothetical protein RpY1_014 [Ralstonia phage RpY1]|nr:hypothetical protein RpY1_014 [Ralstonia phage RpY1]
MTIFETIAACTALVIVAAGLIGALLAKLGDDFPDDFPDDLPDDLD